MADVKEVIVLLGQACSGKDTLARVVLKQFDLSYFPMSDKLRQIAELHPEEWPSVKARMDSGDLVDDRFALPAIEQALESVLKSDRRYHLANGAARTISQAAKFFYGAHQRKWRVTFVNIDANDASCRSRNATRWKLERRSDDRPAVFENRLRVFRTHTKPAIQMLEHNYGHGQSSLIRYHRIDADGSIEETIEQGLSVISPIFARIPA